MKSPTFPTSVLTAVILWLLLCGPSPFAVGAQDDAQQIPANASHRQQAAQDRQEAERLQQAIRRYQIMEEIYTVGSKGINPGFNPMGRRDMVERTKRVLQYFTREKHEREQQAAEQEKLAQVPPASRTH